MANAFQPSLMSQISHELRTPITHILGMVHFLERTSLTPEQHQYIETIINSAKRLLNLEDKLSTYITQIPAEEKN
jgi:signal transduction histidine kinase